MKMTVKSGATCGTWRGRVPSGLPKEAAPLRPGVRTSALRAAGGGVSLLGAPRCVVTCSSGHGAQVPLRPVLSSRVVQSQEGEGSFRSGPASVGNHHSETPTAITPGAGMA